MCRRMGHKDHRGSVLGLCFSMFGMDKQGSRSRLGGRLLRYMLRNGMLKDRYMFCKRGRNYRIPRCLCLGRSRLDRYRTGLLPKKRRFQVNRIYN